MMPLSTNSNRKLGTSLVVFVLSLSVSLHQAFCESEALVESSGEITRNLHATRPDENNAAISNQEGVDHIYYEFSDLDDFPYYPEEFKTDESGRSPMEVVYDNMKEDEIDIGEFILDDFVVGGVNLAAYGMQHPPFLLFDDFDISSYIVEGMGWKDLLKIRNQLQRPSLSWYVDKVARKRWFADGSHYTQPEIYFAKYKDELSDTGKKEDEMKSILANLPRDHGYCAKPTHMSMTMGNWLVDISPNLNTGEDETKFTKTANRLTASEHEEFDPEECADSLAEGLQREASVIESWALKNVRPGIVIEELYSHHEDRSLPPYEFCIFVIWGKMYVGQWNTVGDGRYLNGFFYRDGSTAPSCPMNELPEWVPWEDLVEIAESLSEHKDMFRVDMFVGVPRYSEEDAEIQIAVSESEIHPTTMFCNPLIAEEMARLWVAGYKVGNYEVIPNNEVPEDFVGKRI